MSASSPIDDTGEVRVTLARLEGKLDAALAGQAAKVDEHARRLADLEPRVRLIEQTPTVSPRAMWAGLGTVAALVGVAAPFLDRLYS